MKKVLLTLLAIAFVLPAFAAVDPATIGYVGKKPVRVVIGHESSYDFQEGLTTKQEKGFTIDEMKPKASHGHHYKMKPGQCIIAQFKTSDIGDMRDYDEQFVIKATSQDVNDLGGSGLYGSIRRGKLWGRCPQDNGFGCSNNTISDRDGDYTTHLKSKGLESKELCAWELTNAHAKAIGQTVIGGPMKDGKFLFTVEWTPSVSGAGKNAVKSKFKQFFKR